MGRRTAPCVLALSGVLALGLAPAAHAGQVLRVDGSKTTRANDPFVPSGPSADFGARPSGGKVSAGVSAARPRKPTRGERAVASSLASARGRRAISAAQLRYYRQLYAQARFRRDRLRGQRSRELGSVIATLEAVALRRQLTADRLYPMFLTLRRNTEFWLRSPFPASRGYVQFRGSQMLFEYYYGEGLQLQPLANFKKANALHGACAKVQVGVRCDRGALAQLLDEMVKTRVRRGGFTAWEYYFDFGGGRPPWISGMATATGIQAFGRAGQLLGTNRWRGYARAAMGAFTTGAPTGVLTRGPLGGAHYLQYSFASRYYVINAFLQSVIGLYDYTQITGDKVADYLWRRAEPEARAELPRNDIGDWSTYNYGGPESTPEYYRLLLEFTTSLCHRLQVATYCDTTRNFRSYLTEPARLTFSGPSTVTTNVDTPMRFALSKRSAVQMVITDQSGKVALNRTATFRRGSGGFAWKPRSAGTYTLTLAAKELRTGNDLRTRIQPVEIVVQ